MRYQDVLERAALTFAEAALSVIVAAEMGYLDIEVWEKGGVAGGAALLSFALNIVRARSAQKKKVSE